MMGGDIGVGHGPMRWEAELVYQTFWPPLITQQLIGEPWQLWPHTQCTFPGADPRRDACQSRRTVALLERGAVGRKRNNWVRRPQDARRDLFPKWGVCDFPILNMVDGHGFGCDGPTGVYEQTATL
jgi:hypothetical protein